MQPIEKEKTEIIVPYHGPKIKPAIKAMGLAKPKSIIHKTIKTIKKKRKSKKLLSLKLINMLLFSFTNE